MNAMEKVAWTELAVSVLAVTAVSMLVPWLGQRATSGFALLSLIAFSALFIRRRGHRVVIDERDQEIAKKATSFGIGAAWMMLFMTLIAATMWSAYANTDAVSTGFLNWLIWVQFAICYGVKGFVAIIMYRRPHAA